MSVNTCGTFPHGEVLKEVPTVCSMIQSSSILTLSTWNWSHVQQVVGSVPQTDPISDAEQKWLHIVLPKIPFLGLINLLGWLRGLGERVVDCKGCYKRHKQPEEKLHRPRHGRGTRSSTPSLGVPPSRYLYVSSNPETNHIVLFYNFFYK